MDKVKELFEIAATIEGSIVKLVYSEACGFCVDFEVFGEGHMGFITRDYLDVEMAAGVAIKLIKSDMGAGK